MLQTLSNDHKLNKNEARIRFYFYKPTKSQYRREEEHGEKEILQLALDQFI